jgi:hypothetical protein
MSRFPADCPPRLAFWQSSQAAAKRRHDQLALFMPVDGRSPLAPAAGEFKAVAPAIDGVKLVIRQMPDAPWLADNCSAASNTTPVDSRHPKPASIAKAAWANLL